VEDALENVARPTNFTVDGPGPVDIDPEPCDACGLLSDSLSELAGDRLCDRCDTVFWTAQVLQKSDVTDEAEIIATLAFASHSRYQNLHDQKTQATFLRDFAHKYPSFELVRLVEGVPVIRLKKR
jgi:hypothetical protein